VAAEAYRRPLNLGLVLLFLTLLLGFAVSLGLTTSLDTSLLKSIAFRQGQTPAFMIAIARGLSWLGDAGQRSLIFLGFAIWLAWRKRVRAAILLIIFPTLAGISSNLLKEAFNRARPDVVEQLVTFTNPAYPSGHAANAASIAFMIALLIPGRRPLLPLGLAFLASALVGLSRLWLGVHWPSDVVGGMLWGVGFAYVGLAFAKQWEGSR
jgi:membrane-associated phospholipid phosphatase